MAKTTIHSDYIPDNAITSSKIAENSIGAREIATNAITTLYVADGSVTTVKIADDAITSAKLDTNIDIAGTFDVTGATTLDAGLTVDTDTLVVDATNNRVGIGTESPSVPLTVQADSGALGIQLKGRSSNNVGYLQFSNNAGSTSSYIGSDGSYIGFESGAAERMRINSLGKVGIGNTSPLGKLTISNAAGNNAPNTITAANTYLQLGSDDYGPNNDGKFMIGFGYTDATNTNSPAYIGFEETSTSGDTKGALTFYTRDVITDTAPTERMRIDSSGNVGIGTDSPNSLLDIEADPPVLTLTNSRDGSWTSGDLVGHIKFFSNDASGIGSHEVGFIKSVVDQGSTSLGAGLTFGTATYNGPSEERMRIDEDGNVGIGTDNPSYALDVYDIGEAWIRADSSTSTESTANSGLRFAHAGVNHGVLYHRGSDDALLYFDNIAASTRFLLDSSGNVGIGTDSPGTGLHVKTPGVSAVTAIFERSDASNSWLQIKGNASNGHQIGSTTDGLQIYDDDSATYIAKFNNNTNDHNLQKWCYAEFDVYDNNSADAWEEKANLAANVYSLYGANINPGKYASNLYYVGVGRENTDEAYVEFKVDLVEARSIYANFGVSNSADGSTRYARLWYSYDGEVYTQVANNSFGAGGGSADYTLNLTSVLHHGDGDFSGSVYFRCGLMDNASQYTTLIGWQYFKFKAFAESMTFDGRYKRGSSSTSLVDNSGGGQETNFVPKVPYVHTFSLTSAGASSIETNNGGNGQFTSANSSYLNKEIFQIVSSPTYGIQCLTEGTIFYTLHQDLRTTGSTGYARVYVQRVTSTASASINVGMHLTTNTDGEWDSISGQGSFDVVAGDIIRFNYSANSITSMDNGDWSYYTLMMIPPTTSFKGYAKGNTSFPFAGGI